MTIVEEIDKASGRTQRSKNIVDALKFWWKLDKTPQNIGEAVKMYAEKSAFNPELPGEITNPPGGGIS